MKKLLQAKRLFLSLNSIEDLVNHGYVKTRKYNSSCNFIFINEKIGVVIKNSYISYNAKKPKCAIPTRTIKLDKFTSYRFSRILIQPLADTKNRAKAIASIMRELKLKSRYGNNFDLHLGNVAWYRGKAVLIDW